MGKLYLFTVCTFCKSLCVINEGSPYGLHGDPIYILYLYDHMWLVGHIWLFVYIVIFSSHHSKMNQSVSRIGSVVSFVVVLKPGFPRFDHRLALIYLTYLLFNFPLIYLSLNFCETTIYDHKVFTENLVPCIIFIYMKLLRIF